jgi:peptidoglycan/LPS O-acetylase OafA/YrhL
MPTASLTLERPAQGRLPVLDELKGLAILLIVLYHAGGVLMWNNYLHGDVGVDIFVILSGIGLAYGSAYPGAGAFLRRRLLRILPAYWLVLTAALFFNRHFQQLDYSAANIVLHYLGIHGWFGDVYAMSIVDSFWFITLILSFYGAYPFLHRLLDDPVKLLCVGAVISVVAAFAWFLTGQGGSFGHLGLRLPGFFYGLLLGRLLRTGSLHLPLNALLMLAVLCLTYVPYTRGIVFHTGIVGLALMGGYARLARPWLQGPGGTRARTILRFLGEHSLEIFLLHQLLIRDINKYVHARWLNEPQPAPASLIMGMMLAFGVTLLLSYELRRTLGRILPQ